MLRGICLSRTCKTSIWRFYDIFLANRLGREEGITGGIGPVGEFHHPHLDSCGGIQYEVAMNDVHFLPASAPQTLQGFSSYALFLFEIVPTY